MNNSLHIKHLRHATMILTVGGKRILVDPMLCEAGSMPPTPLTTNRVRIPMTELPVTLDEVKDVDAVLVTHYHFDHIDKVAEAVLPKDKPVFCQPGDVEKLKKAGFTQVVPVETSVGWKGLTFHRFSGNHGKGLVTILMGKSSGFVIEHDGKKTMVGGDCIWDNDFKAALSDHAPDNAILYGGEARMMFGPPITMGSSDIISVANHAPSANIVVVHMEALNHCGLTRAQLNKDIKANSLEERIQVPADGDEIML